MALAPLVGVDGELAQLGVGDRVAVGVGGRTGDGEAAPPGCARARPAPGCGRRRAWSSDARQAAAAPPRLPVRPGSPRPAPGRRTARPGPQLHAGDGRRRRRPTPTRTETSAPGLAHAAILSATDGLANVRGMEIPQPRCERPQDLGHLLRQLADPRLARSRRTPPSPACARRSTRASRPSTPPTSTPTPRPRACSARRWQGERREGLEIFTKVFWPTGPGRHNDHGLSRKHILESIDGSLRRLGTDYVDLYQAHRYDHETPLEETMEAFADVVRAGKALYIGVSEWRAEEIRAGARAGPRAAHPAGLEPAAVQHAVAGHRGRGRARPARSSASVRSSGRRSRRAC